MCKFYAELKHGDEKRLSLRGLNLYTLLQLQRRFFALFWISISQIDKKTIKVLDQASSSSSKNLLPFLTSKSRIRKTRRKHLSTGKD